VYRGDVTVAVPSVTVTGFSRCDNAKTSAVAALLRFDSTSCAPDAGGAKLLNCRASDSTVCEFVLWLRSHDPTDELVEI
jgi:hypothetical protein